MHRQNADMVRINAKGSPEILIYDDIGGGMFGGISSKDVALAIKNLGETDKIDVRLNSAGGDVFEGIGIYNTLRRQNAAVTVHVDGMALSAASVIAMAGNQVHMAENAIMMIHNPWTVTHGSAKEFRDMADTLDKTKNQVVKAYTSKTLIPDQEIGEMMDAETWMTSEEAFMKGFVDGTGPSMAVAAHFDMKRFSKVPHWATERKLDLPRRETLISSPDLRAFLGSE